MSYKNFMEHSCHQQNRVFQWLKGKIKSKVPEIGDFMEMCFVKTWTFF